MITFVIIAAFWSSIIIIFYAYAGFPLVLAIAGLIRNRRVRKASITPSVSLIIAAYNEEDGVRKKLENSLELDYPSDQLEIIIALMVRTIVLKVSSRATQIKASN